MQIIGPDSQVYKETIDGLEYKEDISDLKGNTYSGYDITKASGLYTIAKNYNITAEADAPTAEETQEWQIKIILLNLDADQNDNTGKEVTGEVIIQQEEKVQTLAELCTREKVSECFTKNYKNDKAIVYHNATAASEDKIANPEKIAGDDSYRYSGSTEDVHNYVCFGSECSDNPDEPGYKNLYRIIGLFKNDSGQYEIKIIKADAATKEDLGEGTYPESAYRSNGSTSSYQSTYKGKLTNYGSYAWNDTSGTSSSNNNVNMWAESNLNTKNLNTTYYNAIEESYKTMVVEHEWQVGGTSDLGDAKSVYDNELGDQKLTSTSKNCYDQGNTSDARECNQTNDLIYKAHVGLMYISDYMYGTLPEYWTTTASNYSTENVRNNDWLYLGITEWTLSRYSTYGYYARYVYNTGRAYNDCDVYLSGGVRPVLYLSSDVKITGGSGTAADPFTLEA